MTGLHSILLDTIYKDLALKEYDQKELEARVLSIYASKQHVYKSNRASSIRETRSIRRRKHELSQIYREDMFNLEQEERQKKITKEISRSIKANEESSAFYIESYKHTKSVNDANKRNQVKNLHYKAKELFHQSIVEQSILLYG